MCDMYLSEPYDGDTEPGEERCGYRVVLDKTGRGPHHGSPFEQRLEAGYLVAEYRTAPLSSDKGADVALRYRLGWHGYCVFKNYDEADAYRLFTAGVIFQDPDNLKVVTTFFRGPFKQAVVQRLDRNKGLAAVSSVVWLAREIRYVPSLMRKWFDPKYQEPSRGEG